VCLLARDESAAVGVAGEIASAGGQASARSLNVTDQVAAREAVLSAWGRIDLLVNSAGSIEREVPLWEADVDQWWSVITTNVHGPLLMTREVVPHMIAAGGGRIINLNSGAGTAERAELSAYGASRSALARITGSTHRAGWAHGIRAFDLAPGVVRTQMTLRWSCIAGAPVDRTHRRRGPGVGLGQWGAHPSSAVMGVLGSSGVTCIHSHEPV
jgi:NAD(P)-dependent dehydrogenase (short-subunit alcohol dehydrogenase family)